MPLDLNDVFGLSGGYGQSALAKTAILAGLLPDEFAAQLQRPDRGHRRWLDRFAQLTRSALPDAYSNAITLRLDLREAQQMLGFAAGMAGRDADVLTIAEALWAASFGERSRQLRLVLTSTPDEVNPVALTPMLLQADPRIRSVLFAGRATRDLHWSWPLQIGVPDTQSGKRLLHQIEQGRYRNLYETQVVGANASHENVCDLLLVPNLIEGSETLPFRLEGLGVAAVLALEEPSQQGSEKLRPFAEYALHRPGFGLTGIAFVTEAEWPRWIDALVRELSHNATLDDALFEAGLGQQRLTGAKLISAPDFTPPFLAGDAWFVEQARIAHAAQRIADAMLVAPKAGFSSADVARMGVRLANQANEARWASELGDARDLVQSRRSAEAAIGPLRPAPIRAGDATGEFLVPRGSRSQRAVPRMAGDAFRAAPADTVVSTAPEKVILSAPAPGAPFDFQVFGALGAGSADAAPDNMDLMAATADAAPEESKVSVEETRRVQCTIFAGAQGGAPVQQLRAKETYRARVHIGAEVDQGALPADKPFDETQLPPSDDGHDLQVAFCPLDTRTGEGGIVPAMIETIHLPRHGRSSVADFTFDTGADGQGFRARILILHRNRILETLMLAAPTAAGLALRAETTVNPAFASSLSEAAADIALVVNDNPAGIPGILAVANGAASFSEPAGLDVMIETMESLLSKSNIETAGVDLKLDSTPLVGLLIQLANQGAALARELKRQLNLPDFDAAARIQVVEARSKAYLPVEFVYAGRPPKINATLCPNAKAALGTTGKAVHASCQHANDPQHVCPAAFWGFSKCIERQPFGQSDQHLFSIPVPGADELKPFHVAVLAASKNVTPADLTGKRGVKPALAEVAGEVRVATSWEGWKKNINTNPRATLLVLLPHSDNSPDIVNMPALEIQKKWLTSVELDADYVQPPGASGPGPVVLLLGCSTALSDIPFLNFVREFKGAGASIVLGTLATVHGTHATRFVRSLLGKIKSAGNGRPFDEILLQVKREMLAEGEPFVLSLAAYGHSSWRIHT